MALPRTVVLIGPAAVGKSTVGAIVAAQLNREFVDLDWIGDRYYAELDEPLQELRIAELGFFRAHAAWQAARAHAVMRVIGDHPGAVIALGAGHSHFEDEQWFDAVDAALHDATVVLLMPDADPAVALEVLRARCMVERQDDWVKEGVDYLDAWVTSAQNRRLADHVVYVGDDSTEDVARRIFDMLTSPDSGVPQASASDDDA